MSSLVILHIHSNSTSKFTKRYYTDFRTSTASLPNTQLLLRTAVSSFSTAKSTFSKIRSITKLSQCT